jgi:hypothetical protein
VAEHPAVTNGYENRFIWNMGQIEKRVDWRDPAEATSAVRDAIRRALVVMAPTGGILIDKTPGNALRLDFVRNVLPRAKIVNVIRDGRASLTSRMRMWGDEGANVQFRSKMSRLAQEWNHARGMMQRGSLPRNRVPAFAGDSLRILLGSMLGQPRLAGERVAGLREIVKVHGFEIARAVQWRETVMASTMAGRLMSDDLYFEFRYEDLVRHPNKMAIQLASFLELDTPGPVITALTRKADPYRAEAWRGDFSSERLARLEPVLRPTLDWLGYV